MSSSEKTESKAARTVLDLTERTVTVGESVYNVPKPTLGTLVMISGLAAELPAIDPDNLFTSVVSRAKDCGVLARIVAVLILGAKRVAENRISEVTTVRYERRLSLFPLSWGLKRIEHVEEMPEIDVLTRSVMENLSMAEIKELVVSLVVDLGIADFFAVTTSLAGASLLRPGEVGQPEA